MAALDRYYYLDPTFDDYFADLEIENCNPIDMNFVLSQDQYVLDLVRCYPYGAPDDVVEGESDPNRDSYNAAVDGIWSQLGDYEICIFGEFTTVGMPKGVDEALTIIDSGECTRHLANTMDAMVAVSDTTASCQFDSRMLIYKVHNAGTAEEPEYIPDVLTDIVNLHWIVPGDGCI